MTDYVYKQKNLIYWIVFLISLSELDTLVEGLRYIKYAILPLSILFLFQSAYFKDNVKLAPLKAFTFLLAYALILFIFNGFHISGLGMKDWLFISCYVTPLLALYNNSVSVEKVFVIYFCFTILSFFGIDPQEFSIESSSAPFEGSSSFVFGGFFYYFFLRRSNWYCLISLCMMFLTLKRIALVGLAIVFVMHFLYMCNISKVLLKKLIIIMFFAALMIMIALASGLLDDLILQITGKNSNWFTLGRTNHYMGLFEQLYNNPITLIFGNGLGSAYSYASIYYDSDEYRSDVNLHSDILKISFELGVVFYAIFFTKLTRSLNYSASLLVLYIVIIFLTDNLLIYSGPMFILLILVLKLSSYNDQRVMD